jgi:3',5'-cyclic AMP phosphodiesterase CpdA
MDVTFLVVSDTHFGYEGIEKQNAKLVQRVNALAGHAYPPKIGGTVSQPRGLVVTGDLTEWGRKSQWEDFVRMFGLHGTEGELKLPVFEMVGNHDKVETGPWIGDQVAGRHGGRFYSWDWDDLHLLALGEAPDDEGLAFLARDLEAVPRSIPLVMFFHLALAGPWSTGNWFDDGFKERLVKALDGRKVAAIFHGHHHATGHYVWQSFDVWKPGAVKNDAHTLAVVHVTDAKWTLASYDWESDAWGATFEKPLP